MQRVTDLIDAAIAGQDEREAPLLRPATELDEDGLEVLLYGEPAVGTTTGIQGHRADLIIVDDITNLKPCISSVRSDGPGTLGRDPEEETP